MTAVSNRAQRSGRWRGMTPDERRAARRALLLDAGLEVFGTRGYASSSVHEVCREAQLTERYFYESFRDREALLVAVALKAVDDFLGAVMPLAQLVAVDVDRAIEEGLKAFMASVADDPRKVRILMIETVGVSPAVEDQRRAVLAQVVEFLRQTTALGGDPRAASSGEFDVIARALVGAGQELLVAFVRGELSLDRAQLTGHLIRLFQTSLPHLAALSDSAARTPNPKETLR